MNQASRESPVATLAGRQDILYSLRQFAGAVPYGKGVGALPRERSDLGGTDDASLSELRSLGGGTFWLRDRKDGAIYAVDFDKRRVLRADLGNDDWTVGFARGGPGQIAALIGARKGGEKRVSFRVAFYGTEGGSPQKAVNLPSLQGSPQALAVSRDGIMWIAEGRNTRILDAEGAEIGSVAAIGMALPAGVFLTHGTAPEIYSPKGQRLGAVKIPGANGTMRFLAAGPDGAVLARGNSSLLPEAWRKRVQFMAAYRFDLERRELVLNDRITTPDAMLDHGSGGATGDGLPVRSYFPPESVDFDEAGNIVSLELTGAECRLYRCQKLGSSENWREKFLHPEDLNREELEIARTEYSLRAGISGPPPQILAKYFEGLLPPPARRVSTEVAEKDLRNLDTGSIKRP